MAKPKREIRQILPYNPLDNEDEAPPVEITDEEPKKKGKGVGDTFVWVLACFIGAVTLCGFGLLMLIIMQTSDDRTNRANTLVLRNFIRTSADETEAEEVFHYEYEAVYETFVSPQIHIISDFDLEMREINSDFVAWINVPGTRIDYPVVRAEDNEKYLNTSFFGERNRNGAIFMDYRNVGEVVPHIIIYGHNVADGSMFTSLHRFRNPQFLADNNIITLRVNDRYIEYEIFAARLTDVNDLAYFLDFSLPGSFAAFLARINAPPDAMQILTLSTCVSRGNDNERMIVQAALRTVD